MSAVAETWMPVSGRFKTYPLDPVMLTLVDDPVIWSKGHHDPAVFLAAAQVCWREQDGDDLEPAFVPKRLRDPARVRCEWWATRHWGDMCEAEGWSYMVETVQPFERGAYPVTVIDL